MKKILLSASGKGRPSNRTEPVYALVDDEDYEWLSQWNWTAILTHRKSGGYATRNEYGQSILMHRLIMDAKEDEEVDHKNNTGLDNQRENLRIATTKQNRANKSKYGNNTSGFKGVSRSGNKWQMHLKAIYDTPEEAAQAYDACARILFGKFANLNYPETEPRRG